MRITFVLPSRGLVPIGGFKVVYEYANYLAARGHAVNVVHPHLSVTSKTLVGYVRTRLGLICSAVTKSYLPSRWFSLDPKINAILIYSLKDEIDIPDADIIIATMWWTSEFVAKYAMSKGRKFYLIQHYENWGGDEARLINTWHLPLHKIVISKWLAQIAMELDESYTYIPNGLDHSKFGVDIPIENRNNKTIMMLYHEVEWKGSKDGLQALSIVKEHFPDLTINLFGVPAGDNLPYWVNYHRLPSQQELRGLYNQSAIFLAPSWNEGWPLPPAEAMMCGAAVVGTDIGGHREYLGNGVTGSLVPVRQPDVMANAIMDLIRDSALRIKLATAGTEFIRQFTWDRATTSLLEAFEQHHQPPVSTVNVLDTTNQFSANSEL